MKRLILGLMLVLSSGSFIGCGGAEEVGGSDLNSEEARKQAEAARAGYAAGNRGGPQGSKVDGPPAGRGR